MHYILIFIIYWSCGWIQVRNEFGDKTIFFFVFPSHIAFFSIRIQSIFYTFQRDFYCILETFSSKCTSTYVLQLKGNHQMKLAGFWSLRCNHNPIDCIFAITSPQSPKCSVYSIKYRIQETETLNPICNLELYPTVSQQPEMTTIWEDSVVQVDFIVCKININVHFVKHLRRDRLETVIFSKQTFYPSNQC